MGGDGDGRGGGGGVVVIVVVVVGWFHHHIINQINISSAEEINQILPNESAGIGLRLLCKFFCAGIVADTCGARRDVLGRPYGLQYGCALPWTKARKSWQRHVTLAGTST